MDTGQSEDAPLEVQDFGKEVDDSHSIMPSNCNWVDDIIETDGDEKKVNYFHLSELLHTFKQPSTNDEFGLSKQLTAALLISQ